MGTHSVGSVFSPHRSADDPLLIGSVKSNLGHSEAAAGITALIKVVLAIENKMIPATIDLVNPSPNIHFDEWKIKVVQKPTPWPANIPIRRASVNSFGYGGANAHAIIEGYDSVSTGLASAVSDNAHHDWVPITADSDGCSGTSDRDGSTDPSSASDTQSNDPRVLLICTAKNSESLNKTIDAVRAQRKVEDPPNVACTLAKRSLFPYRAFCVTDGQDKDAIFNRGEVPSEINLSNT